MFAAGKTSSGLVAQTYVDDVFSTYLYTGNSTSGGTQTITTNVDLSTYGGMVWIKGRSAAADHILTDTVRGAGTSATASKALSSNLTSAESLGGSSYDYLSAFSTTGFTVKQGGTTAATRGTNYNAVTYAAWTFRKQAKFFDIVTYTGNGANRTISHNLGSVPGCIIVKSTSNSTNWYVYHRSYGNTGSGQLNSTNAFFTDSTSWNDTTPTSSVFTVGSNANVNQNGYTYVAYLFAHDTATDGVIQCGSYVGNGSVNGPTITLGWEPQFILRKDTGASGEGWYMVDVSRGMSYSGQASLQANSSGAETASGQWLVPTATGFKDNNTANGPTYIYLAIRRPNKPPTSGTQVYNAIARAGTGAAATVTGVGFAPDLLFTRNRDSPTYPTSTYVFDRMRGGSRRITTVDTSAESSTPSDQFLSFSMDGMNIGADTDAFGGQINVGSLIHFFFKRAPGVFDEVCYTGTGSATTVAHNLGVVPELMIVKRRGTTGAWPVYSAAISNTEYLVLNTTAAKATGTTYWNSTTPTSSVFSLGTAADVNASTASNTYVAYLFASAAGISKVGSYTGTGTTLQVNCGFTGGARFVLIKRTDSTGDWYVWDSARGIVAGNDPYLLLNSTAAEVTTTDYVDAYSAGFEISSTAPAAINANGGTFLFLAIA